MKSLALLVYLNYFYSNNLIRLRRYLAMSVYATLGCCMSLLTSSPRSAVPGAYSSHSDERGSY